MAEGGLNIIVMFSVIIPCYNDGLLAIEAIDSCLMQSSSLKLEIIFVDDGSTDSSYDLVASRYQDRVEVKTFRKENGGLASTRNFGIAHAKGDYLLFLDSDDKLGPMYFRQAADAINSSSGVRSNYPGIILSPFKYFNQDPEGGFRRIFLKLVVPPYLGEKPGWNTLMLLIGNFIPVSSCLVARHLISLVGTFDVKLKSHEDWDFWIRVMMAKPRIAYAGRDDAAATFIRIRAGMTSNKSLMQMTRRNVREKYCAGLPYSLLKTPLFWVIAISIRTLLGIAQMAIFRRRLNLT